MLVDRIADHAAHLRIADVDVGHRLAVTALAEDVGQAAIPVHVDAEGQARIGQDAGRPFDRVDLGHQRRVDQPRDVERRVVRPIGIGLRQMVANGVVLAHEQGVQQRHADPPIAREAGVLHPVGGQWQAAIVLQPHLAADMAAQTVLRGLVAAVDLRAVPPMRDLVDRGPADLFQAGHAGRIGLGAADEHLGLPVARARRVVVGQGHLDRILEHDLAMVDPVTVHELDPGGGKHVQERHLLHHWRALAIHRPRQQLQADLTRVRRQQWLAEIRSHRSRVNIAQKARAGGALFRVGQVVPAAVGGAEVADAGRWRHALGRKADQGVGRVAGAQVVGVELVAHVGQCQDAQRLRPVVPIGPDRVAVAGQTTPGLLDHVHHHGDQRAQLITDQDADSPQQARTRLRRQRPGQSSGVNDRRREQGLAVEVRQLGHMDVNASGGIGLRHHPHLRPRGMFRPQAQGLRVLRGRLVVLRELEVGRPQQGVLFGVGLLRQPGLEQADRGGEVALTQGQLGSMAGGRVWQGLSAWHVFLRPVHQRMAGSLPARRLLGPLLVPAVDRL